MSAQLVVNGTPLVDLIRRDGIEIAIFQNPWPHTIPDMVLSELIYAAVKLRSDSIQNFVGAGRMEEDSTGFCVLDPTAPMSRVSSDSVLFTAAIGGKRGRECVANGAAKVCAHRDYGVEAGELFYSTEYVLPDGCFEWGYSACVNRIFGGGSGASENQDRHQVTALLNDLSLGLLASRKYWREMQRRGRKWLCDQNIPGAQFQAIADILEAA